MRIDDSSAIYFWAPQSRFRFVQTPAYHFTSLVWQEGVGALGSNNGLVTDYDLQIAHPPAVRVPSNNILQAGQSTDFDADWAAIPAGSLDSTLAKLNWVMCTAAPSNNHTAACKFGAIYGPDTKKPIGIHCYYDAYLTADTGRIVLVLSDGSSAAAWPLPSILDCCAVSALITARSQPVSSAASGSAGGTSTTPNVPSEAAVSVMAGSGASGIFYRVRCVGPNGDYIIEVSTPGTMTFRTLQTVPAAKIVTSADEDYARGPNDLELAVEFRLIAGRMSIRLGSMSQPYTFAENRTGIYTITQAMVEGTKVTDLAIHDFTQVRFQSSGGWTSPEIPLGFNATAQPSIIPVWATPASGGGVLSGYSASLDGSSTMTGTSAQAKIDLAGPTDGTYKGTNWSKYASPIRAITFKYPGAETYNPAAPLTVLPQEITISHAFDPDTLQIVTSGMLVFNSNLPTTLPTGQQGTWAQWALNYGQVACEIWLSRTLAAGGMGPLTQVATGYASTNAETRAGAGGAVVTLGFSGRLVQCSDTAYLLPWMDGWNVFYAAYFLAQLLGVAVEDMAFSASVPNNPFDNSFDENGLPAYFLPVGSGGSVITRVECQPIWEVLSKISLSIGYMMFFDAGGSLQFRKFRLPAGTKRTFFDSDWESAQQSGGGVEGAWEIALLKDMDNVRSELVVAGTDLFGFGQAVVAKTDDEADVTYNPNAFNHLGYRRKAAWVDAQFIDPGFAAAAAAGIYPSIRIPSLDVQLTTWLQPDIFPLDVIAVNCPKLGLVGTRLFVLGVQHHKGLDGPATTTISARHFVPS